MPSFAVRNFGCRVNQAEAFAWADAFQKHGLKLDGAWDRSDVVLINSCTLTGRADRDVRKFIRTAARVNPAVRIVVTGCLAERAPAEIAAMPNVVAVVPRDAKAGLVARVLALAADLGHVPPVRVPDFTPAPGGDAAGTDDALRARAYLKVQDGCDNRCAYCIIPGVRGGSRSVPTNEVVASAGALAGRGFREIVLAGINMSSYGEDLEPRSSLAELLRALGGPAGRGRLRLSSLDPRKTDEGLIDHIAGDDRICPHVHLSLQHASQRVLRLMGRPTEPGAYDAILERLRRLAPEAALGADLMVGFPGETGVDFEEMRAFLERSPLTYAHVFPYSPRPGTPAATRPQVPASAVTERARALRRVSALKDYGFRRRFLGRELEAVVIDRSAPGAEVLTANFIKVFVPACAVPRREGVRVAIRRVLPHTTEGEVIA